MKIAVIGGTGLIGSQVVSILNASGHEAVPHSPESAWTCSACGACRKRWTRQMLLST